MAEVGGAEGRRIAAGPGAEHQHVAVEVGRAGERRGRGAARSDRGAAGAALPLAAGAAARSAAGGVALAAAASSTRIALPCETLSPSLTFSSFTTPPADDGISIDALSLSTVISDCSGLHRVAGLDQHLDHLDVLEVADVGYHDVDQ